MTLIDIVKQFIPSLHRVPPHSDKVCMYAKLYSYLNNTIIAGKLSKLPSASIIRATTHAPSKSLSA